MCVRAAAYIDNSTCVCVQEHAAHITTARSPVNAYIV